MNSNDIHPTIRGAKRGRPKTALMEARSTLLDEEDAIKKATWLYYHRKLTQQQIAQKLGISRPTVVRLLRRASVEGLAKLVFHVKVMRPEGPQRNWN
jgi:predicted DNA-binding protein (UPF0251 family)